MYRIKWRAENGGWRVSVFREIGPTEFRAVEFVAGNSPSVELCCQAEQRAMNKVTNEIIEAGGSL